MKMAVARDADGFRVMNSFLKAGLDEGLPPLSHPRSRLYVE
jgi:hypothetical protein